MKQLGRDQESKWTFHWLTSWEEIWDESFVREWLKWMDESPSAHVFFHPAMVKAWVDTYLSFHDIRPFFLIAETSDRKLFFPLVLWNRKWKCSFPRLLIPAGYPDYDYHDPILIMNTEEYSGLNSFWTALIDNLKSTCSVVAFDRCDLLGIHRVYISEMHDWTEYESCPWLDLSCFNRPEEFLPSLKASLRGDLRRQERRIHEIDRLECRIFTEKNAEESFIELTPFLAAHSRRWPDSFKTPKLHENILKEGLASGILHFSVLKIGKESAAWHLGFTFRDRYYYYMPAHELKFARLSPGKILLLKCIEDAISRRLMIYDFLRGEESYKADWTKNSERLRSLTIEGTDKLRNGSDRYEKLLMQKATSILLNPER